MFKLEDQINSDTRTISGLTIMMDDQRILKLKQNITHLEDKEDEKAKVPKDNSPLIVELLELFWKKN
jgi:hypothetical protein